MIEFKDMDENRTQVLCHCGTCLEYVGIGEDVDGNEMAMFELFETGYISMVPSVDVDKIMTGKKAELITGIDWKKRIIALSLFGEDKKGFDTYLGIYDSLVLTDDEVKEEYKKYSQR